MFNAPNDQGVDVDVDVDVDVFLVTSKLASVVSAAVSVVDGSVVEASIFVTVDVDVDVDVDVMSVKYHPITKYQLNLLGVE